MKIIKGKRCRKCGSSNIYLDYDLGSWYQHCLMCGQTSRLKTADLEIAKMGFQMSLDTLKNQRRTQEEV